MTRRTLALLVVALVCLVAIGLTRYVTVELRGTIRGFQDEEFGSPLRYVDFLTVGLEDGSERVLMVPAYACCLNHPYDGDVSAGQVCDFEIDLFGVVRKATCIVPVPTR